MLLLFVTSKVLLRKKVSSQQPVLIENLLNQRNILKIPKTVDNRAISTL